MARSVPLSRPTLRVGGGSAFFVRPHSRHARQDSIVPWDTARAHYRRADCSSVGIGLHLVFSDD